VGAIGAVGLLLRHVGEREAADAVDAALREGFRTGRIKGVDAGSGRTMEVAEGVARSIRQSADEAGKGPGDGYERQKGVPA